MGFVLLAAGVSHAGDRYVVKRDGRKYPVVRSTTEYAVMFQSPVAVMPVARRMAAKGRGVVEDFPFALHARIKRVRVSRTSSARRRAIGREAGVVEVRPIYRFAGSDAPLVSTGTMNVRVRPQVIGPALQRLWNDYRVQIAEPIDGLAGVYCVKPLAADEDEVLRAASLAEDARTVWAEPNFRTPLVFRQAAPADPFFSQQWHLNNTGQLGGVADADLDAPEAWLLAQGQDVIFGMFDDSCDVEHEDLRGGYIGIGHDPTLPSTASGFTDPRPKNIGDAHGTAVMGLAVARANSVGVRGVSFLSRFTASRGLGDFITNAQIAGAYTFARQQKVDVHINSWGLGFGLPIPSILEDAIQTAFDEGRDLDGADGPELPRGMVVVFASGNGVDGDGNGTLVEPGKELATLPTVIGVGASTVFDQIASYSNFGPEIDVLAPGGDASALITTTDNNDAANFVDSGFNIGGVDSFSGFPDIDPTGLYSGLFSGTSASCPIVSGVAGLVLSANKNLTAVDVRVIIEHASDRISPADAAYDPITKRSRRYGYGRVNALRAVEAAQESFTNGGRSWPVRVAQVSADNGQLRWVQNGTPQEFRAQEIDENADNAPPIPVMTTNEFLVVESDSAFVFGVDEFPIDGLCYDRRQVGCGDATSVELTPLPEGVRVLAAGCNLTCGATELGQCEAGAKQCVGFLQPAGTKFFGIFARSVIGRYAYGVKVDTSGNVLDDGRLMGGTGATMGTGGGSGAPPAQGPNVTIQASPRSGMSPLTVRFTGNASSEVSIDDTRTAWDFDVDDEITVDTTSRNATHTYVVPAGESLTFMAKLTMFDINGNGGSAQVAIRVEGSGANNDTSGTDNGNVRILIGIPGTVGSDIDTGVSPLAVQLGIDTAGLIGSFQSVRWDLGDGTTASSLFVTHTYINETQSSLRLPVTATVTTLTAGGTTLNTTTSRTITILPGSGTPSPIEIPPLDGAGPSGSGGTATPCGTVGMIPLLLLCVSMMWLRRRGV